eukprot:CAMPEP_0117026152 /NCGR_PEP_ID=MMETSP0472-20121206/19258_1 /TAXON_ID=693140 ORGANISM="Tiarina fusus, Strain LIS" /NCGR_SAMPLE_ID=MMETSP0472 /ASSEMBLY_ACC=CAM_ASM_000603 /LENGTH=556 /DNA_ID=CAMNT_0004733087 /DNA_START=130 /DNA_END=1800 /DNA_ORIENTATION=-
MNYNTTTNTTTTTTTIRNTDLDVEQPQQQLQRLLQTGEEEDQEAQAFAGPNAFVHVVPVRSRNITTIDTTDTTNTTSSNADEAEEGMIMVVHATTVQDIVDATRVEVIDDQGTSSCSSSSSGSSRQQGVVAVESESSLPKTSREEASISLPPSLRIEHVDIDNHEDDPDYYFHENVSRNTSSNNNNENTITNSIRRSHDDTHIASQTNRGKEDEDERWSTTTKAVPATTSTLPPPPPLLLLRFACTALILPTLYFSTIAITVRHSLLPLKSGSSSSSSGWIHRDVEPTCEAHYENALQHFELLTRHALIEFGCAVGVLLVHVFVVIMLFRLRKKKKKKKDQNGKVITTSNPSSNYTTPPSTTTTSVTIYATLLILEVPMFLMALLLAICGYLTVYSTLEEDPFTYPTGTLAKYCNNNNNNYNDNSLGFETPRDDYFVGYVMTCIRIVLSFGMWIGHGRGLYHQVSVVASAASSGDAGVGEDEEERGDTGVEREDGGKKNKKSRSDGPLVGETAAWRIFASSVVSVALVSLSAFTLFGVLLPIVKELRDMSIEEGDN